jgi:hypothetical protein
METVQQQQPSSSAFQFPQQPAVEPTPTPVQQEQAAVQQQDAATPYLFSGSDLNESDLFDLDEFFGQNSGLLEPLPPATAQVQQADVEFGDASYMLMMPLADATFSAAAEPPTFHQ